MTSTTLEYMQPMAHTGTPRNDRGDTSALRAALDHLVHQIPAREMMVVSLLPRGSFQIIQPQSVSDSLLKAYLRGFHSEDLPSWQAIIDRTPVRAAHGGRYLTELLEPLGYAHGIAAPLEAPLLEGYPGAVQLFRTADQGDFTDADLRLLGEAAVRIDRAFATTRHSTAALPEWVHRPQSRVFAFDASARPLLFEPAFRAVDERIRQQILQDAKFRVAKLKKSGEDEKAVEPIESTRLVLPDSDGDLWTLNAVAHRNYPALGGGPVILYCLQPSCPEWGQLRPADFNADPELSRLIPAIKFMQQEYGRGPTLVEIAKVVHLSPFHFHRRFTELLGLTPKHFLLECQIYESKTQLLTGEKELSRIADDCGFAHQSHFTSRFKQATGLTPTRWRRMALDRRRRGS